MFSPRWTFKHFFHPEPKPHPPNCSCAACKAVRGLHVEGYTTTDDDDESGHW